MNFDEKQIIINSLNSNNNDIENKDQIIYNWTQTDNCLLESVQILIDLDFSLKEIRFKIISLIKNKICQKFFDYNIQEQNFIKDSLISILFQFLDHITIIEFICLSISEIFLLNFSNEFIDNLNLFQITDNQKLIEKLPSLYLLKIFLKEIDLTTLITSSKRISITNFIIENISNFLQTIKIALQDEETNSLGLFCLSFLLKWSNLNEICNFDLIYRLCLTDLYNEKTLIPTLECLTIIFINRIDFFNYSYYYIPLIIYSIFNGTLSSNNNLPLTNDSNVFLFLNNFLIQTIPILELYQKDLNVNSGIDDFFLGLNDFEINLDEFFSQISSLFKIIISSNNKISINYWKLWIKIFRIILNESDNNCETFKPISSFFGPIFNFIRESIFNNLSNVLSDEDDDELIFHASTCWTYLFKINPKDTIEFLLQQSTSISLCISIGFLESFIDDSYDLNDLYNLVINWIDNVDSNTDPNFILSLLYTSSKSIPKFLNDNFSILKIINFILIGISLYDSKFTNIATQTLSNIIQKYLNLFLNSDFQLIDNLINFSSDFLLSLNPFNSCELFKVTTILISFLKDEIKSKEYIVFLMDPLISLLYIDGNNDYRNIYLSLDIIKEFLPFINNYCLIFFNILFPIIIDLFNFFFNNNINNFFL